MSDASQHLQVMRPARTEVEVAAMTVALIIDTGLVKRDATTVARMAKAAGVTPLEVRSAWRLVQDGKTRMPTRLPAAPAPSAAEERDEPAMVRSLPTKEQLAAGRRGGEVSKRRAEAVKNPEPGMRVCSECGPDPKPVSAFRKKGLSQAGLQVWDYLCKPCRRRYQRDRYVRAGYASVKLELLASDEAIGAPCSACRGALAEGDVVCAGDLRHDVCPTSPKG